MADCRKCVDFEWCAEHEDCGLFKPKQKQTNADRIRAMTDEELAEWIISITEDLTPRWIDWLKEEAKE